MLEFPPSFPYYADPVGDEQIVESDILCDVCYLPRQWAYVGGIYAIAEPEQICPWCVADGKAATKYIGQFQDVDFSENASEASRKSVMQQTPRVVIWNPIIWPDHCGECCTYQGMFIPSEQSEIAVDPGVLSEAGSIGRSIAKDWTAADVLECAEQGSITLHLFQCRQCGAYGLAQDGT